MAHPPPSGERLQEFLANLIEERYPQDGVHGHFHPLRLLAAAPGFCLRYGLPEASFLWAIAFHDIARDNDDEDGSHGRAGAEKLLSLYPAACTDLVEALLVQHCLPQEPVGGWAKEVAFFKDLDALDRLRFGPASNIHYKMITEDRAEWEKVFRELLTCREWEEMMVTVSILL